MNDVLDHTSRIVHQDSVLACLTGRGVEESSLEFHPFRILVELEPVYRLIDWNHRTLDGHRLQALLKGQPEHRGIVLRGRDVVLAREVEREHGAYPRADHW